MDNPTKAASAEIEQDMLEMANLSYLPYSFEGMMESFGVNLQRQSLYQNYYDSIESINTLCKKRDIPVQDILTQANKTGESMRKILEVSIADSSSLKNDHN